MRLCDGVITTNAFLAEKIRDFSGLPTWTVPNFLNRAQIELSSQIRAAKQQSEWARDSQIDIGYFSGTPTHARDFALIESALVTLLESNPAVRLRIVGFPPQSELLAPLAHRIETLPLQDFLNLQRMIGAVEINVVPLQDNEFTNCKSELKYFEAAIVGTVTIATPTFTYRQAIDDGRNGYLATAQQWAEILASGWRRWTESMPWQNTQPPTHSNATHRRRRRPFFERRYSIRPNSAGRDLENQPPKDVA